MTPVQEAIAEQPFHKHSLNVVIPGINDRASVGWLGTASALSPTRERYVISPYCCDGPRDPATPFAKDEGFMWAHIDGFPDDHVIRFNPNDSKSVARVQQLAQSPNATFVIDMDLGLTDLRPRSRIWDDQTDWAAKAATTIAEAHIAAYPDSFTTLLAHSAGTDAMLRTQQIRAARDSVDRKLFTRSVAASPRDPSNFLDKSTLLILADGDFAKTPGGAVGTAVWRRTHESDAIALAQSGFSVLRIVPEPKSLIVSMAQDLASGIVAGPVAPGVDLVGSVGAHGNTIALANPDQKIIVYAPGSGKSVKFPGTSLTNVIDQVTRTLTVQRRTAAVTFDSLQDAADRLKTEEPTPGLGGISLNAVARVSIDPRDIIGARYDEVKNRLLFSLTDGRVVTLPPMDREVLLLAFRSLYLKGMKPELSIGSSRFVVEDGQEVVNLRPPGRQPVYYLGASKDTLLGLVMLRADEALGKLAFGSSAAIKSVSDAVPGFHSLAELFPEKYTAHPASADFSGSDLRVFLNTALVELTMNKAGDALEFGTTAFAVRFGRMAPAEHAFAEFFLSHFDAIAATSDGTPLRQLAPFARAAAVFKWLRAHGINCDCNALSAVAPSPVFTPGDIASIRQPTLDDINPRLPTVLFGNHGPIRLIAGNGRATTISYANGLPEQVRRVDGALLRIIRDSVSNPLIVEVNGSARAAFLTDSELGPVFVENAAGGTLTQKGNTLFYLDNQPDNTVGIVISRFLARQVP